MIEVKNLLKTYGDNFSLKIDELKIANGESFGLVGNNGAGKTTLFRLVLDLIEATKGAIFSDGKVVARSEHWKAYTGSYLDENFLIDFLTAKEYMEFVANLNGLNDNDLSEFIEIHKEFLSEDIINGKKYIRDLSRGSKSKVGIISALLGNPQIIVLDEPFAHLDPTSQIRLKNMLISLKNEDEKTLLISSHDLKHVTEVCDRIVILDNGEIKKDLQTSEETLKELESYFTV